MEQSITLRTEHVTAEIEWLQEASGGASPHCFVSIGFDTGGTLTMCGDCVPEFLDFLTQAKCSIDERKEVLVD